MNINLGELVRLINATLSAINFVIIFSLLIYVLSHNWQNRVARSFCALIATLMPVYIANIVLIILPKGVDTDIWLRIQWLGFAFVPATYLQFSNVLLETTNVFSRRRRQGVRLGWAFSIVFFAVAGLTDLVIIPGVPRSVVGNQVVELVNENKVPAPGGALFWVFFAYLILSLVWGISSIIRARVRALTTSSRRRLTYLVVASVAPAVAILPYLLTIAFAPSGLFPRALPLLTLTGNIGLAILSVVMAYSVSYNGVLTPDRVVKHSLVYYLLRGPLVAIMVIVLVLVTSRVQSILGVPRDIILVFAAGLLVVLAQAAISVLQPWIDRLLYRNDGEDILSLRELDKSLLTNADLEQLFENTLASLADLLRANRGFLVVFSDDREQLDPRMAATVGWEGGTPAPSQIDAHDREGLGGSHALGALAALPGQVRANAPRLLGRTNPPGMPTIEAIRPLLEPFIGAQASISSPTVSSDGNVNVNVSVNVNVNVNVNSNCGPLPPNDERFISLDGVVGLLERGYLLLPLRTRNRDATLGVIGMQVAGAGVAASDAGRRLGLGLGLSYEEEHRVGILVRQAEVALEDSQIQRRLFATLRQMSHEMQEVQRWRGTLQRERQQPAAARRGDSVEYHTVDTSIVDDPDFARLVKGALDGYWGGPRLSESPLLKLKAVHTAMPAGSVPTNALRKVLDEAIEALRPSGAATQSSTPEWTIYNILSLRYKQGLTVRDVAHRLAMSEADYYRKQKTALAEVAKAVARLEREALRK